MVGRKLRPDFVTPCRRTMDHGERLAHSFRKIGRNHPVAKFRFPDGIGLGREIVHRKHPRFRVMAKEVRHGIGQNASCFLHPGIFETVPFRWRPPVRRHPQFRQRALERKRLMSRHVHPENVRRHPAGQRGQGHNAIAREPHPLQSGNQLVMQCGIFVVHDHSNRKTDKEA